MAKFKCPGMDPAHFKPEDIKIQKCLQCGTELEFWKDDVKIVCDKCGLANFNPALGNTCLVWCKSAAACLGNNDIQQWMAQNNPKGETHEKKNHRNR